MGFAVAQGVQFMFEASPFDSKIKAETYDPRGHSPATTFELTKKHALAEARGGECPAPRGKSGSDQAKYTSTVGPPTAGAYEPRF